jgi:uncharacterized protein YuzE
MSDMKVSYNREDDVLLLEVSEEVIEYAEEVGPLIIHFTKEGKPVLVEILDASEVLTELTKVSVKARDRELAEVTI